MNNLQSKVRILIAFFLVMTIILLFQFSFESDQPLTSGQTNNANRIDFFVRDAVVTRWSIEGSRESITTTDYAEHLENQKLIRMSHPYSVGYGSDGKVIHTLNADSGNYLDDNSRIDLAGSVELHHNPESDMDTALYTEQLSYYPNKDLATTDLDVEFLNSSGQTTATGMEFYTRENRVELLSAVKGAYVPTNTK